ncbi:hypothetical protein EVAR_31102_1 [Eumeta japonica]|uniref:Uncharacterized protein n=1 Tax=Eumeta variegata TaxID=151549 RepID=A0A4C1VFS7_EUMVA|nr:hypothetical protein EVAR_31102_1 [Eumeta japonica]
MSHAAEAYEHMRCSRLDRSRIATYSQRLHTNQWRPFEWRTKAITRAPILKVNVLVYDKNHKHDLSTRFVHAEIDHGIDAPRPRDVINSNSYPPRVPFTVQSPCTVIIYGSRVPWDRVTSLTRLSPYVVILREGGKGRRGG